MVLDPRRIHESGRVGVFLEPTVRTEELASYFTGTPSGLNVFNRGVGDVNQNFPCSADLTGVKGNTDVYYS